MSNKTENKAKKIEKENNEKNKKTEKSKESVKEIEKVKEPVKTKKSEVVKKIKEPEINEDIEEADILAETLKTRKKMPKEIRNKITDIIFSSIIMIILMIIINLNISVLFANYSLEKFEQYIKIIQIGVCLGTIAFFEYSYKKDSFKNSLYGIEFLIFSIAVLYVPYMYNLKENLEFMNYVIKIFVIYYIIKSLVFFIYTKRKFSKENLSDVKEIVKKEEKEGYLDD